MEQERAPHHFRVLGASCRKPESSKNGKSTVVGVLEDSRRSVVGAEWPRRGGRTPGCQ